MQFIWDIFLNQQKIKNKYFYLFTEIRLLVKKPFRNNLLNFIFLKFISSKTREGITIKKYINELFSNKVRIKEIG